MRSGKKETGKIEKPTQRVRQKKIQITQVPKRQLAINLWVLWARGYRKAKTQNPTTNPITKTGDPRFETHSTGDPKAERAQNVASRQIQTMMCG